VADLNKHVIVAPQGAPGLAAPAPAPAPTDRVPFETRAANSKLPAWLIASAKMAGNVPVGLEMTQADFDALIAKVRSFRFGYGKK
jgi:hypothetical protein